jgi:hypothetical protein
MPAYRFHDLRATFVTWAKRAERPDDWIRSRTGTSTTRCSSGTRAPPRCWRISGTTRSLTSVGPHRIADHTVRFTQVLGAKALSTGRPPGRDASNHDAVESQSLPRWPTRWPSPGFRGLFFQGPAVRKPPENIQSAKEGT